MLRRCGQNRMLACKTGYPIDLKRQWPVVFEIGLRAVSPKHIITAERNQTSLRIAASGGQAAHCDAIHLESNVRLFLAQGHIVKRSAVDHEFGAMLGEGGFYLVETCHVKSFPVWGDQFMFEVVPDKIGAELARTANQENAHGLALEKRKSAVTIRHDRAVNRPFDAEGGIIPAHASC
jgi:hypothetical protein